MQRNIDSLSYEEWFELAPIQVLSHSFNLGWNAAYLQIGMMSPSFGNQKGPMPKDLTLVMVTKGKSKIKTTQRNMGISPLGDYFYPGYINLVPIGFQTDGEWDSSFLAGMWSFNSTLLANLISQCSNCDPSSVEIIPRYRVNDTLLNHLLIAMSSELEQKTCFGALYADSLAHTIMLHLLKHYSTAAKITIPQKGCLSPSQKALLEDYIAANLAENIQITALAQLLHLSVSHLERLFRASYGVPIYRYVIQRRIEHAKRLLIDKNLSLLQVSVEAGFTSQSHFNHHFKAAIGLSPKRFRDTC